MAQAKLCDRWNLATAVLSDQHGPWCAWCVDYISSPDELELHHVLGYKERIRGTFRLEPWVVPVHRDRCHRSGLQDYADEAGRGLLDSITLDPERFEQRCKTSFHRGNLPACLLLRRYAWAQAVKNENYSAARTNLLYALNAAAGSRLGNRFVRDIQKDAAFENFREDLDIKLYAASVHANAGNLSQAWITRDQLAMAVPRVRPASSATYAKLVRMTAILGATIRDAKEALNIARDSADPEYHQRTSRLALASAYEAQRNYNNARAQAELLLLGSQGRETSWWHSIEQLFLWSRAAFLSRGSLQMHASVRPQLTALIQAQYAAALLDFVGIPVPDFRTTSQVPNLACLTPTSVVHWVGGGLGLSKEYMTEIRREAILNTTSSPEEGQSRPTGFQEKVLATLRFRDIPTAA